MKNQHSEGFDGKAETTEGRELERAEAVAESAVDDDSSALESSGSRVRHWARTADPAWLRLIVFSGGLVATLVVLIIFDEIFTPLLVGLGLAYLFDPPVSWLQRKGWSRLGAVIFISVSVVVVVVALLLYLVPAIGNQVEGLQQKLPEYQERLEAQAQPILERFQSQYSDRLEELQGKAQALIEENLPRVAESLGKGLGKAFSSVLQFVLFLLNLIFIPVFAFYLLVDWPKIKATSLGLVPKPYQVLVQDRLKEVDTAVGSFLRGQLTIALVLAAINSIGLMILGVPMGLLIGLIAGLANMIPYMALVVGLVPALVLCWAEDQSVVKLLLVIAVFGGAQLLEGTVLSPRILSQSVNLHPVWVLLAVIAGGSLFGFFGMMLAVPVAAAIQVFVRHWLSSYKQSKVYRGAESEAEDPAGQEAPVV
ncbi:MAG: AI-2E family transporter [Acidobacteriota bacterium]